MTGGLRLDGVVVEHRGRMRLQHTDLSIRSGVITAIIGANGSGKSTLLELLAGQLAPSAGRVLIGEADVRTINARELARRRALLTQDTQVAFAFTVFDVVSWGRAPWRGTKHAVDDRDFIESSLERFGLLELADRPVTELSGGERKRVHLARVWAQQAEVLILDEADSDLDLIGTRLVDDLVHAQQRLGRTAVLVSHDLSRIGGLCDDVVLMHRGRVLASGPSASVLTPSLLSSAYETEVRVERMADDAAPRISATPNRGGAI